MRNNLALCHLDISNCIKTEGSTTSTPSTVRTNIQFCGMASNPNFRLARSVIPQVLYARVWDKIAVSAARLNNPRSMLYSSSTKRTKDSYDVIAVSVENVNAFGPMLYSSNTKRTKYI